MYSSEVVIFKLFHNPYARFPQSVPYALDDMILFIEDEQPTEEEIIEKTAELLQK